MARRTSDRWRCLTVGCNPTLKSQRIAEQHRDQTGHRIARWPVRSAEGQQKQRERNQRVWEERQEDLGHGPELGPGLYDGLGDDAEDPGWDGHKHDY